MGFPISGSLIAVSNNDILFDKRVYFNEWVEYHDLIFVVLFIYIAILCMKNIRKLRNIKIDSLSVRRAVITEKQSVKSKDLINRSRNRFVAAKIDDNVTLYAMCSQKEYERTMVNKSIGLFFTLGDDTIRVIVL